MISPYLSYFLGILTILIPFLILYIISFNFDITQNVWSFLFCNKK